MNTSLTRRALLKTGVLFGTVAATSTLAILAPKPVWALDLKRFDPAVGSALLKLTRHIFPHDTMDDAVYALVVKDLDAAAASDDALAGLLEEGVATLDAKAGGRWLSLDDDDQFAIVRTLSGEGFFEKVRSTAVVSLYNNPLAFAHFGYEGEAFSKGGYINRGFQDLKWLPEPPADASPAKA